MDQPVRSSPVLLAVAPGLRRSFQSFPSRSPFVIWPG